MIITRTPFRVSLVGGGSDFREFYRKAGYGAVVSLSIKRYMYIVIHPYFHDKIRIKYSKTEDVETIDEIEHPIVRECLKKVRVERGLEIASFADVPAGTGLGSSSAFTVGLLHALYCYNGKIVDKEQLAREACEIEIDILGEPIGKQDQYAVACGNINHIRFNRDESVNVSPVYLNDDSCRTLEQRLFLLYLGGQRKAGDILAEQKSKAANGLHYENLKTLANMADDLLGELNSQNVNCLGALLDRAWQLKKKLASGITSLEIDSLYAETLKHGAEGGKVLGAGGTGFLLLYSPNADSVKRHFPHRYIDLALDREGTKLLHYDSTI